MVEPSSSRKLHKVINVQSIYVLSHMHINKSILSILVLTALSGDLSVQSIPTMTPSRVCAHTNEQVFLSGTGFNPGATVQGYLISSHYRSPIFGATADTNGAIHGRYHVPRKYRHERAKSRPGILLCRRRHKRHLPCWYQTYNSTNEWHAVITNISTYTIPPPIPLVIVTFATANSLRNPFK